MTYTPTKPDQGPSPFIDVPTIQQNFAVYNTVFSANHVAMNKFNQGNHKGIIFQNQTDEPDEVINSAHIFSFDAPSNAGIQPQLWVKVPKFLPNEVPNTKMQLTYNEVNIAGPQYQSFLMGGYLIYFGVITGNTSTIIPISTQITLVPAPTEIVMAIAVPNTFNTQGGTFGPGPFDAFTKIDSTSQFTISSSGNGNRPSIPYTFSWVAIGTV